MMAERRPATGASLPSFRFVVTPESVAAMPHSGKKSSETWREMARTAAWKSDDAMVLERLAMVRCTIAAPRRDIALKSPVSARRPAASIARVEGNRAAGPHVLGGGG